MFSNSLVKSVIKISLSLLFGFLSLSLIAEIKEIVILQTTDIHGHIFPNRSHNGEEQGWLKVASLVEDERKRAGKDSVLLIDCGDTIQGTLDMSITKGMLAAEMLNLLKYDAWIIGNHDYDFGYEALKKVCNHIKSDIFAANLKLDKKHTLPALSWKIYNRDGARIALIGMTSPGLNNWIWGDKLSYINVEPVTKCFAKLIPEVVKAKPDMIILAVHFGLFGGDEFEKHQVSRIIKRFPQIDLVLGGHIHVEEPGHKVGRSTWFGQSGKHSQSLLKVKVKIDTIKHKTISISSKLIKVKKSTKSHAEYSKKVAHYRKVIKNKSYKKIGELTTLTVPLKPRTFHSNMSELFGRAITKRSKCKLAIHGVLSSYSNLYGKLNEYDIYRAAPFEDTIGILELNKFQIKKIIEEQIRVIDKKRFQSPFGMSVILDKSRKKVINILIGENELTDGEKVKVAFNSYALAGAGGKFPILKRFAVNHQNNPVDTKILVRDALKSYIADNSPLHVKMKNWIKID